MGLQEDALQVIQEAVKICQQLATDHLATCNPDLAHSLNNLSNCLSDMGLWED